MAHPAFLHTSSLFVPSHTPHHSTHHHPRRSPTHSHSTPGRTLLMIARRPDPEPSPDASPDASLDASPLPSSLPDAAQRAGSAIHRGVARGLRRMTVEVDTSQGDMTYTLLKNSMPLARSLVRGVARGGDAGEGEEEAARRGAVAVVFPDSGTAALARRDWARDWEGAEDEEDGEEKKKLVFCGMERAVSEMGKEVQTCLVVSPRAVEAEGLEKLVDAVSPNVVMGGDTEPVPFVMVNPDMIDMGVTGLSYAARQLRLRVFDTFETVFYLKTMPWGVLYRDYPDGWYMWEDDVNAPGGFRKIAGPLKTRPSGEEIENILEETNPGKARESSPSFFGKLQQFLKVYMKG